MLQDKNAVAVITGGNSGLGFHAATTLVKQNACVVIGCRSLEAGNAAKAEIMVLTGCAEGQVVVLPVPLDLSNFDSVRAFAGTLKDWLGERRVSTLMNNAGIAPSWLRRESAAGHELVFATNYLGEQHACPQLTRNSWPSLISSACFTHSCWRICSAPRLFPFDLLGPLISPGQATSSSLCSSSP